MLQATTTEEVHRQWRLDNMDLSHPPHLVDASVSEYVWIPKEEQVRPPWVKGRRPWVVVARKRVPLK